MKKNLLTMLALVAMLLMPGKIWAEITMTFSYVDANNAPIEGLSQYDATVSVYSKGETATTGRQAINDDNWNFTGSWKLTFDDAYAGKTVSYETLFGQRGTFTVTDGGTVTVQLYKLTVTVKDTENNPISDAYVYIYKPSGSSNSYYTNNQGQIVKYFAGGEGFRWTYGEQEGNFDLTGDYALNITKQAATSFNLSVKARYGDYPLSNRSFTIYKYGDTKKEVASIYGGSAKVDAGDYWVRDDMGVFSEKFTVSADMTYWVDYNKVTFTSMTGTTPNKNQDVRLYYDYNPDSYNYNTVRTDDMGEATIYLQAGNYTYRHLGVMTDFTVGNADQTIAIKTSSVTITLDCSATAEELEEQSFTWAKADETDRYNSTNVKPEGKTITIAPIMAGDYKLTINGTSTIDVKVAEGENTKTVTLYALQFTTNIETTSNVYVNEGDLRMAYNKKYFLTAGDYPYAMSYYSEPLGTVNLTKDTDVALNYGILTVTVKDSKGVVEGQRISFGGSGRTTDENGQATFTKLLAEGDFTLAASDCYVEKEIDLKAGEQTAELVIPDVVTFNALHLGEPLTANNLWIYSTADRHINYGVTVKDGVATVRLNTPLADTYAVEGYQGSTAITEGCTLSLGQINITCDGMGVALPMENWEATSTYNVLVGSVVRLAAIPVGGTYFQKWTIEGTDYAEGMIDYTIKQPVTTATAVFSGEVPTKITKRTTNTTFDSDGQYVYLPSNAEGSVNIYSVDGKLMKNIGVSGGKVGIYDLPKGVYVITVSSGNEDTKVARFMKE